MSLSKTEKEVLVCGYIKTNSNIFIPLDLIELVLSYYNASYYYWSFKGDKFQQFCAAKHEECIVSKSFKHEGLTMVCKAYPNGEYDGELGFVQFYIGAQSVPYDIDEIIAYVHLFCEEPFSDFKNTVVWGSQYNDLGWDAFQCKLEKCKKLESVTLCCYIDILRISRKDVTEIKKSIQIRKYEKLEWKIDGSLLQSFKTCHIGQIYYTDSFGFNEGASRNEINNWSVCAAPKGCDTSDGVCVRLSLILLALPFHIKKILISIAVDTDCGQKWDTEATLGYDNNVTGIFDDNQFLQSSLLPLEKLTFWLEITILKAFDENDNVIDEELWVKK